MTDNETHPSPGMRSHWPVIPEIRLLWTIMTPLGLPVEPLVYITTARSEGWGFTIALPTARQTINYNIVLYLEYNSSRNSTTTGTQPRGVRNLHHSQGAFPALAQPACCGRTVLLGSHLCSLSSGPHRSDVSVLEAVAAHSGWKGRTGRSFGKGQA